MRSPLKVLLVHVHEPLAEALAAQGCEVVSLMPPAGGVLDLTAVLAARGFAPDLILQQEHLGPRVLLAGLEQNSAVRVFWSVDPHLNAFWQAPYLRLFDLVFSTQRRWMDDLRAHGAEEVQYLPWYAPLLPFTPYAQRNVEAAFVGRLGPSRPVRTWLVEQLQTLLPGRFQALDNLSYEQMLALYQRTRLIPNESITGEVNFRLFEAAGSGCVVLAQDLGQEQAELFTPGREIFVASDGLELAEIVGLLLKRPALAEAVGRAAWERAQADHSPERRARSILEAVAQTPRRGLSGTAARSAFLLTLAGLLEAGRLDLDCADPDRVQIDRTPTHNKDATRSGSPHPVSTLQRDLAALPQEPLVLAARLRTLHALQSGHRHTAQGLSVPELLDQLRLQPQGATEEPEPWLTSSMCALRLHLGAQASQEPAGGTPELDLAWAFAARAGVREDAATGLSSSPAGLLAAWAERLLACGRLSRGGFGFDPDTHLPGSALECLYLANTLAVDDPYLLERSSTLSAQSWGADVLVLGVLSRQSLFRPGDWRLNLRLGLCDLKLYRTQAGLEELAQARRQAQAAGQGDDFAAALAQADASGRLRRALG